MSELIKENKSEYMIDMARLRLFTILSIIFVAVLLSSSAQNTNSMVIVKPNYTLSQTSPDVWAWGIEGDPLLGQGFDVWANVTDTDSDLRNVSVQVTGPNMTLNNLLTYNGTFYTGSVPAFPNDGLFNVLIRAYDLTNRSRTSYNVDFEYEENPIIPIDPNVSMPFVVGSSIGLVVLVIGFAMFYDRRKNPVEQIMQHENGTD
ncbi:MAG: hypothetical protein E3J86_09880 [Candidatus Thorarchaeota archaeon]|nr:MAG: hypothetical protein E3J86_09880 [Candidatus Thorarchaeota archaeon]